MDDEEIRKRIDYLLDKYIEKMSTNIKNSALNFVYENPELHGSDGSIITISSLMGCIAELCIVTEMKKNEAKELFNCFIDDVYDKGK